MLQCDDVKVLSTLVSVGERPYRCSSLVQCLLVLLGNLLHVVPAALFSMIVLNTLLLILHLRRPCMPQQNITPPVAMRLATPRTACDSSLASFLASCACRRSYSSAAASRWNRALSSAYCGLPLTGTSGFAGASMPLALSLAFSRRSPPPCWASRSSLVRGSTL